MCRSRLVAVLFVLLVPGLAWADEALSADSAVGLLVRALAYDRSLNPTDGVVQLLVVTRKGQPPGDGEAFAAAAAALSDQTVQGAKLKVNVAAVATLDELHARLSDEQPHVLYLAAGFEFEAAAVLEVARRDSVHCLYGTPGYAAVLPLGVLKHEGTPRVVVRRAAARALGMVLDPQLLKLALLVD